MKQSAAGDDSSIRAEGRGENCLGMRHRLADLFARFGVPQLSCSNIGRRENGPVIRAEGDAPHLILMFEYSHGVSRGRFPNPGGFVDGAARDHKPAVGTE